MSVTLLQDHWSFITLLYSAHYIQTEVVWHLYCRIHGTWCVINLLFISFDKIIIYDICIIGHSWYHHYLNLKCFKYGIKFRRKCTATVLFTIWIKGNLTEYWSTLSKLTGHSVISLLDVGLYEHERKGLPCIFISCKKLVWILAIFSIHKTKITFLLYSK